jgi:hypothetical protein
MANDRQDLHSITMTAFVGPATPLRLEPPRDYVDGAGATAHTNWILRVGWAASLLTLHVDDPAKLWELHDLIAATLPPREQDRGE